MRRLGLREGRTFLSVAIAAAMFLFIGAADAHAAKCKWPNFKACAKKVYVKSGAKKVVQGAQSVGKEAVDVGKALGRAGQQLVKDPRKIDFRDIGEEMGEFVVELGDETIKLAVAPAVMAKAPILAGWITATRANLLREGVEPIPPRIKDTIRQVVPDYPERLLNKVRYRVGTGGALSVSGVTQTFGDAAATTLDYVIVFKKGYCRRYGTGVDDGRWYSPAEDTRVWAHELRHVMQYDKWGIYNFSIEYLRNWNGVEKVAYRYDDSYERTAREKNIKADLNQYASCRPIPLPIPGVRPRGLPGESGESEATPTDEDFSAMQAAWVDAELSARTDESAASQEGSAIGTRGLGPSTGSPMAPENSIVLERQLYFVTPAGQLFPLAPGTYLVGQSASRKIRLYTPDNRVNIELNTAGEMHEENVAEPVADITPDDDNPDFQYVTLLLPNRTVLVAAGSVSGKRPEGEVLIR